VKPAEKKARNPAGIPKIASERQERGEKREERWRADLRRCRLRVFDLLSLGDCDG